MLHACVDCRTVSTICFIYYDKGIRIPVHKFLRHFNTSVRCAVIYDYHLKLIEYSLVNIYFLKAALCCILQLCCAVCASVSNAYQKLTTGLIQKLFCIICWYYD